MAFGKASKGVENEQNSKIQRYKGQRYNDTEIQMKGCKLTTRRHFLGTLVTGTTQNLATTTTIIQVDQSRIKNQPFLPARRNPSCAGLC